jgi:hypothetical protein
MRNAIKTVTPAKKTKKNQDQKAATPTEYLWRQQPVVDGHEVGEQAELRGSFVAFNACCIEARFGIFGHDVNYRVEVVWQKNFIGFDLESGSNSVDVGIPETL